MNTVDALCADFDARIAGLKLLAGLLPKPTDRMRCMTEILHLRSQQLRVQVVPPPNQFSDAGCELRPKAPGLTPTVSPTAAVSAASVGVVGIHSR